MFLDEIILSADNIMLSDKMISDNTLLFNIKL
jgi:hypothetical protein